MNILYEDEELLVMDKPGGIPTLPLKDEGDSSLAADLAKTRPELENIENFGIAHRLDNDTSGIICAGKTPVVYEHLRAQFASNKTIKVYSALALGSTPMRELIDDPIAHHPRKKKKMVVCESENRVEELKGRDAHTLYEAIARYEYRQEDSITPYTLLDVTIATGVRHQIRVHLAWIGYPVAGDRLYQNPKKQAQDLLPLNRHFLHASRLEITHPTKGEHLTFKSPLPEDLEGKLDMMTKS
jgi:23S rRNA pseudouridine1911/1915/1917 synthase